MRIAFLCWRDSTHPDGGGSEVYVEQIAAELARRGHTVTLVCAAHGSAPSDERWDSVRVRRRGGRLTVYLRGLVWAASPAGRQQDVVVDVINGVPFWTPVVRRHGLVALVHHTHRRQWQLIYPGALGRLGWFVESRLTPLLYHRVPFVTVSEASRSDLEALGLTQVQTIRNGTPAAPRGRLPRSTTPRLCVLARLVPHKRIEHAVDLVASLRSQGIRVDLDLIGEGWWRPELERRVATLGAEEYVHLHGHVDEQTRSDLLGAAWLMVLPSVKEGWGIAVLEAADQGTPTIAYSEAGGVQESIRDGVTGALVEDEDELVTRTSQLLSDPSALAELGEAARRYARGFSWASGADAFEELCARVTARTRARAGSTGWCSARRSERG